jgi:Bacterial PH domain
LTSATFDKRDQYDQIASGLLQGESIIAVYDAIGVGTGFLGLTDRRVIIQDKSFAGKRFAITSIPYARISAVSVVSNKSWAGNFFSSGTIVIQVGPHTYEVELRGSDKTHHAHNVILHYAAR